SGVQVARAAQAGVDHLLAGFVGRVVEAIAYLGRKARHGFRHPALFPALALHCHCLAADDGRLPGLDRERRLPAAVRVATQLLVDLDVIEAEGFESPADLL